MSGGIHAKRGFNYQDTVILYLLITHFAEHGPSSTVRPEGVDDLELTWSEGSGPSQTRFVQVKKPREDRATNPTGAPWTLAEITNHLIPDTLRRLSGNVWEQHWILGDNLSTDAQDLLSARANAPTRVPFLYWFTVHRLAKRKITFDTALDDIDRRRFMNWRPNPKYVTEPRAAISYLVDVFARDLGEYVSLTACDEYTHLLNQVHGTLPDVLSRLRVFMDFGSEEEVTERITHLLGEQYSLDSQIVSGLLFRNLRGFVNDVSTIPDRYFDGDEFELELRNIWPTMMPIREPPPLDPLHIRRRDVSSIFTSQWSGTALEVVGISGSGKTMLASEVCERACNEERTRRVVYVEVRPTTELRDVLVGVAFHLRRHGVGGPFAVAARHAGGRMASEVAVADLARAIADASVDTLLLIDLVEGGCSVGFARDLRTWLEAAAGGACRLAVLGQERAFRYLTDVERERLAVRSFDIRGFRFEEFLSLISGLQVGFDYAVAKRMFDVLTTGRRAGLHAQLARTLAETESLDEMLEIVRRNPNDLLPTVERRKFADISDSARMGAEYIVCFALPFTLGEAQDAFPHANVGIAIRELLDAGLLRAAGEGDFEMHEAVRSGLENAIALDTRRHAHSALAGHYRRLGLVSTEIFHLERGGEEAEAHSRARGAVLSGQHWRQLIHYVADRGLVSAADLIQAASIVDSVDGIHVLPDVISVIGREDDAKAVLNEISNQSRRFGSDFNWAMAMAGAFLSLASRRAHELYRIVIHAGHGEPQRESAIGAILIASRRYGPVDTHLLIGLFDELPPDDRVALFPVLLQNGKRDCLRRAFQVIGDWSNTRSHRRTVTELPYFRLDQRVDVVEFLSSVPEVSDAKMLALKSPLLGQLSSSIWKHRSTFDEHCPALIESVDTEPAVLKAAIRVLALTGNRNLCDLCDELANNTQNPIHGFAALAPSLVPSLVDLDRYEARLLDHNATIDSRLAALRILAAAGADLDRLYQQVHDADAENVRHLRVWEFLFFASACETPFRAAIPILNKRLSSTETENDVVLAMAVKSLGTLPGPESTAMLMQSIVHTNPSVRGAGALGLQERRSRDALASVIRQIGSESDSHVRVLLAAAIACSGPIGVAQLGEPFQTNEGVELWRCVVAARTRDGTFATNLVHLANDRSCNWKVRRAAIDAAGYLPFEVALAHMLPAIREWSTLEDDHIDLAAHSFLAWLLEHESQYLRDIFRSGRAEFIELLGDLFNRQGESLSEPDGLPAGVRIGEWTFNRLSDARWPDVANAPNVVIHELRRPLLFGAGLRSMRRLGRLDLVEAEIGQSDRVWCLLRGIIECMRGGYAGEDHASHLRGVIAGSAVGNHWGVDRVLRKMAREGGGTTLPARAVHDESALVPTVLSYEDAVQLLSMGDTGDRISDDSPVLLENMRAEELTHLVELAGPEEDVDHGEETFEPGISFVKDYYTSGTTSVTHRGRTDTVGSFIRPAIVAANVFRLEIPWHDDIVRSVFSDRYMKRVLDCVAVANDSEVLYDLLSKDSGDLMKALGNYPISPQMRYLVDARIVPILMRYLFTGTEEEFENWARITRQIEDPEVDKVLEILWERWCSAFTPESSVYRVEERLSHHLWRAFRELTSHPRFERIKDWYGRLARVLYSPMLEWFNRKEVIRVLERSPRSYIHLEAARICADDWVHLYQSETDLLDEACERLFPEWE